MKKRNSTIEYALLILIIAAICPSSPANAQPAMTNIDNRNKISLDGEWKVIIDPAGVGEWRQLWREKKPQKKTDFVEYSFDAGPTLHVPGDFNTQMPELTYVEGAVWYKKTFNYNKKAAKRLFLYFGAVNYLADVYLNGKLLGKHEGGFTPFQFELTDRVAAGENSLIVKADNGRRKDGLPGLGYDWFNYGGITREVYLVETNNTYIKDYFIQLQKHSLNEVVGWIKLNGATTAQKVRIRIPEAKVNYVTTTDKEGYGAIKFSSKFELWSPENPKLYKVLIQTDEDTVKPSDTKWSFVIEKPLVISEFGAEAKYGSNYGPKDEADSWSEEYQEQVYKDQIELFRHAPNLAGISPWLLVDYRSLGRMHPVKQNGYNRKGLLSEWGEKKKAWYVLKNYYESISDK